MRGGRAANFVVQGSILAAAGILVRIIGMLYRMPLNDIIGKQGNGYYTSAYNVYNILLILSSYSMPVAVSKMISSRLARGEYHNCRRILKAGLVYATAVGGIAAAVLWFGADLFAELIKTPMSRYALKTLAPTIWIMAYLGVLRGYFQGMGTMVPTALSQILEQIVNAVVSVVAAGLLFQRGLAMNAASGAEDYSYALGAAGGTIGTGAGALTALLFFILLTVSAGNRALVSVKPKKAGTRQGTGRRRKESYGRLMYLLTITVLPIVISSGVYNCSNVVDNYLFGQGMDKLGYGADDIAIFWGALGQYQLLFNIPVAVSNALSSSLIPSLTRAVSRGDKKQTRAKIASSIRFSMLIAIPAAVGITALAEPVCNLLFVSEDNSLLIRLSMAGSLAVVFYSLSTVTNAILQGLNRMDLPIRHSAAALVIHVAVLETLLLGLKLGIYSVVLANIVFALVMCLLNARSIARTARYRQEIKKTFVLPSVCSLLMGVAAYGVYRGLAALFPAGMLRGRLGMALLVFPSVAAAMAVYGVLLVKLGAVNEEELKEMPMGTRLTRVFKKLRLL
ncbi:MAG TPA: polysaccharide biosynthesis protein [Candidatus Enterocloster excrementipullorum]|uniref:Polysaccharide biosynthesis protein n=1 Tax=Candidatus Enterocloster excrementipullorum TaxID=2838559 RepID=A0A9D2MWB0_9FIRM|nr:polysaccharide biosynthesis protein [Candidatus Enterocloster excrementipullorum]